MGDAALPRWSGDSRPFPRHARAATLPPLGEPSAGVAGRRVWFLSGLLLGFFLLFAATADQAVADLATPASGSQRPAHAGLYDSPGRSSATVPPAGPAAADSATPANPVETAGADAVTQPSAAPTGLPGADAPTADPGSGGNTETAPLSGNSRPGRGSDEPAPHHIPTAAQPSDAQPSAPQPRPADAEPAPEVTVHVVAPVVASTEEALIDETATGETVLDAVTDTNDGAPFPDTARTPVLVVGPVAPGGEPLAFGGATYRSVDGASLSAPRTATPSVGIAGTSGAPVAPSTAPVGPVAVPATTSAPAGSSSSTSGGHAGAGAVVPAALFGHHDVDPPTPGSLLPRPHDVDDVVGGTNDPGARPD